MVYKTIPSHQAHLCEIGESPIWLASHQSLFWVDTENFHIHQYCLPTQQHQQIKVPVAVTAIAPTQHSDWLAATKTGLYRCNFSFENFEFLIDPTEGMDHIRLNDAVNCPNGDLWFGTMNEQQLDQPDGCIYRYQAKTHTLSRLDDNYAVANGIAFNTKLKRAYISNMFKGQIIELQMSSDWSVIMSKKVFIQFEIQQGLPDGLTTDSMGNIHVCHWNRGCISIYTPLGQCLDVIELPVLHATRCTFGGENLSSLFITTAWYGMTDQARDEQPLSGRTFVIHAPVLGKAEHTFAG